MKKYTLIAVIFVIISILTAQDTSTMTVEIVLDSDHGWPIKVNIEGYTAQEPVWLGISMYPYGTIDYNTYGNHEQLHLAKGSFSKVINVEQSMLGGSFEAALWGKKVDKIDCVLDYCHWCKTNGFHLDDLLVYKSGLLNIMKGYDN